MLLSSLQAIGAFVFNTVSFINASPQVELNGTIITGVEREGVEFFGAIPYAEPPLGKLRLSPAVLKDNWNVTSYDASEFGKACLQPGLPLEAVSEDCLSVNIFRPTSPLLFPSTQLPVLLWIHGGGFVVGSGSRPGYEGSALVRRSVERGTPVIVLTINYRLGPLGFPQGIEAASKGNDILNLGLKDPLVALQWVKNNIEVFGGDPEKITVFGESAGARAIELNLLNGSLEGLARGAILESSGSLPTHTAATRDNLWRQYILAIDSCVSSAETDTTIDCLRATPSTTELFEAFGKGGVSPTSFDWSPVIDGDTGMVPDYPSRLKIKTRIPVLYGNNKDEGSMAAPQDITGPEITRQALFAVFDPSPAGDEALRNAIDDIMAIYTDDPIVGCPFGTGNQTFGLNPEFKRFASLFSDLIANAERRLFAEKMNEANLPMFTYLFSDPDAAKVVPSEFASPNAAPGSLGVPHTSEILYVFGNLEVESNDMPDSAKRLSTVIMDYWISFATELNPNDGKGLERPEWVPYIPAKPVKFFHLYLVYLLILSQGMMQLHGQDTKMIQDTFRVLGMEYINKHAVLFDR